MLIKLIKNIYILLMIEKIIKNILSYCQKFNKKVFKFIIIKNLLTQFIGKKSNKNFIERIINIKKTNIYKNTYSLTLF